MTEQRYDELKSLVISLVSDEEIPMSERDAMDLLDLIMESKNRRALPLSLVNNPMVPPGTILCSPDIAQRIESAIKNDSSMYLSLAGTENQKVFVTVGGQAYELPWEMYEAFHKVRETESRLLEALDDLEKEKKLNRKLTDWSEDVGF